jgi:hypothetical protein
VRGGGAAASGSGSRRMGRSPDGVQIVLMLLP